MVSWHADLKSGTEIYISEDLYLFITDLFKDWNTWLESGKYEIIKDEQGLYTVLPKKTNQSSQTNSVTLRPIPRDSDWRGHKSRFAFYRNRTRSLSAINYRSKNNHHQPLSL